MLKCFLKSNDRKYLMDWEYLIQSILINEYKLILSIDFSSSCYPQSYFAQFFISHSLYANSYFFNTSSGTPFHLLG
jgi:hypothetical protein